MAHQPGIRQAGAGFKAPALGKLYATQIALLSAASLCSLWVDITTAYSVLLGGLTFIVPNGFFARQAFRYRGAQATLRIAQAFYRGETKNSPLDHGELGAQMLEALGQPVLAEISRRHLVYLLLHPEKGPRTWEEKIVHFADKICEGPRFVEWEERLAGLANRYPARIRFNPGVHSGGDGAAGRAGCSRGYSPGRAGNPPAPGQQPVKVSYLFLL